MLVLPPGTILQLMYLRERLSLAEAGNFIEIGPGSGEITRVLLDLGWQGVSYDLERTTVDKLKIRFSKEITEKRFDAVCENFLESSNTQKINLVISCMMMEHLSENDELAFIKKAKSLLRNGGVFIGLVPSSPKHWGIEDVIAGHLRRYTRKSLKHLLGANKLKLEHLVGLTYPVSNFLLTISNFLVSRSEREKLSISQVDKTKLSGQRNVKYKTHFPSIFGVFLNTITIYPFFVLQKIFKNKSDALVLYFEARL
jgi:phospholipid N-methyltransferase